MDSRWGFRLGSGYHVCDKRPDKGSQVGPMLPPAKLQLIGGS